MRTAIATADSYEEGARHALLERLVTDLAVIAEPWHYQWTCCWLSYTGPRGERWLWQMCGWQITCGHWHHRIETFMA